MQNLRVTLVQADTAWEDWDRNREIFDLALQGLGGTTDLVVLPEMFTSGFTMNAAPVAQAMDGPAPAWMKEKAATLKADVTGSLVIREGDAYYNRLLWATPSGGVRVYDKKHLFRYAGEEKVFTPGKKPIIVEVLGWKIRPFICYDLRFPVWTRNLGQAYHAALFTANWPARRSAHWNALLAARAIENQAYVIGVNRVGTDGKGLDYSGDSQVLDPQGNLLFRKTGASAVHTVELSMDDLLAYRSSFPAWMDADTDFPAV